MSLTAPSPALERLIAPAREARTAGRTRAIVLAADADGQLVGWLQAEFPDQDVLLVADAHTFDAAGQALETALSAAGRAVRRLVLEPRAGDDHLVCEDGVIRALGTVIAAHRHAIPVAVGAGTVNDIVKMAAFACERDYVVVPTAASMNGYTSLIAAVLQDGVKRTQPAQQPIGIFCNPAVLRAAPPRLNRAGFGDLLSKPFSHADWLLSHLIRGVPYSSAPSDLLDEVFAQLLDHAHGVGVADDAGLRVLMEAILLSGFSMTIAGTSAPASGGEHLVSHYWDMEQLYHRRPLQGLHGTQVGIATRLSALLYERLLTVHADDIDPAAAGARRPDASWLDGLADVHDVLGAEVVAEIRTQIAAKQRHGDALSAELTAVRERWPAILQTLSAALMPASRITWALRAAGCPDRASLIGVDLPRLIKTLRVCRHIRGRYVALDLLDDLGLLHSWADDVAHASEEAP